MSNKDTGTQYRLDRTWEGRGRDEGGTREGRVRDE